MLEDIRAAVDEIGEEILGYTSADVGTHSVRSSLAMLMYLAGEPVYTIMLISDEVEALAGFWALFTPADNPRTSKDCFSATQRLPRS